MNDELRTIKPDFVAVRIDETEYYSDEVKAKVNKIWGVYLFDKKEATYCCSMTPSYCLHHMGVAVDCEYDDSQEQEEFLCDIEHGGDPERVSYYNCSGIDSLPKEDFDTDFHTPDDKDEWETREAYDQLIDDMIEYYSGNPTF